jgi:hypothetical protein
MRARFVIKSPSYPANPQDYPIWLIFGYDP